MENIKKAMEVLMPYIAMLTDEELDLLVQLYLQLYKP